MVHEGCARTWTLKFWVDRSGSMDTVLLCCICANRVQPKCMAACLRRCRYVAFAARIIIVHTHAEFALLGKAPPSCQLNILATSMVTSKSWEGLGTRLIIHGDSAIITRLTTKPWQPVYVTATPVKLIKRLSLAKSYGCCRKLSVLPPKT